MKKSKNTNYECPLCQENLRENTEGMLTSQEGHSLKVYFCQECEQSFVRDGSAIKLIPFRDDMTAIRHECLICAKIETFDQNICFVFNGSATYSTFCVDCAIEFYRNWLRRENNKNVESVTKDNLEEVSQLHTMICMNKLLENPKYIEYLQNDPAIKELKKKFDDKEASQ